MSESWRDDAACGRVGGDLWFPENGGSSQAAKDICNYVCEVQEQCLAYVLANDIQHGIWAGLSLRDRRNLKHSAA